MAKPRVFLSFDSDDLPQIRGLRLLASNPNYDLEFYDESLKELGCPQILDTVSVRGSL